MSPAMTEDEMVRALRRQTDMALDVAQRRVREWIEESSARGQAILESVGSADSVGVAPAYGISGRAALTLAESPARSGSYSNNSVLARFSRSGDELQLTLKVAPRTKKNSQAWLGVQSPAYRRYRDDIIAALVPLRMAYGEPILPDREYNCAATFYVDKKGEPADFNGLNQGLHDALENAGVISDDWYFRTCDGTRVIFGDDEPRVDVLITPLTTGT